MAKTSTMVKFGDVSFSGDEVVNAVVFEEFNPLSIVLPISTLELTLYSEDQDFSILNPLGNYALLKEKQPLSVYETIDGTQIFIGLYFLSEWKNSSQTTIEFTCVDQIGLLDTTTFKGGIWLTPVSVETFINQISDETGVQFEIDPDIASKTLSGWIPICSHRDALQQIVFAAGAYALSARQNGYVKIGRIGATGNSSKGIRSGLSSVGQSRLWQQRFRPGVWDGVEPTYEIKNASIGSNNFSVTQKPIVTGVEISSHNYSLGTNEIELYNADLEAGQYEITFNQPYHSLSVSGGAVVESGANYVVIELASPGTVTISGKEYIDSTNVYGAYAENLSIDKQNILTISEATMINTANAQTMADLVFEYYQNRFIQKCDLLGTSAKTGSDVKIETLYYQNLLGTIEKMKIDLAKGYRISAEIIGDIEKIVSKLITGVFGTGQSRNWQTRFRSGE
jgi:hypothetical protein